MLKWMIWVWVSGCVAGIAQTNGPALFAWGDCLAVAKQHSPELARARSALRELEFGVASARAAFYPQLSANGRVGISGEEAGGAWEVNDDSTSLGVALSQDLFSGYANVARRDQALARMQIGQAQFRQTQAAVELQVRLAYLEVLYAQDLVVLTQKIAVRRRNNVRLIQLRFDGGRENAGSLARSKAQASQSDYEVRQAKRSLQVALRNLAAALGQRDVVQGVSGVLNAPMPEGLEELEGLMMQTPEYAISETQVKAAEYGLRIARSDKFPSVGLSAGASASASEGWERWSGSWSAGLNASMKLFTGGRTRAEIAASQEQVMQSEFELEDLGHLLMATLQEQWSSYVDAVESEAVQKELLEAEQLRAEIATAKYQQGLLSYEDWDLIESNLINQGKTHLQRRRAAAVEQARWKRALGRSDWQEEEEQ